jgi:signal transduction histidine kinase
VIACNNDGLWNDAGAVFNFGIAPAYYQKLWVRLAFVAFCIATLGILYRLRVRQIAAGMNARFNERLAERTRLARDFHDTLLQTIQGSKLVADDALEEQADPIRMRDALERLSGWLAQAMDEGRSALNSLRSSTTEGNDLAEAFQRAGEEYQLQRPIEFSLAVEGSGREMHPIVRDEVYRIGYEAIRNASAHSQASTLNVELSYIENLTLRVRDNGTGIDPVVGKKGKSGHFGLIGMYERAARIGGKLTVTSSPGGGTEVELIVPRQIVFPHPDPLRRSRFERIKRLF